MEKDVILRMSCRFDRAERDWSQTLKGTPATLAASAQQMIEKALGGGSAAPLSITFDLIPAYTIIDLSGNPLAAMRQFKEAPNA